MITVNDIWEISCDYYDCLYCDEGVCFGGLYQCPHNVERAKVCLPKIIEDYESFKSQEPYGEEYYIDLADFESKVYRYKQLAKGLR